MKFKIMGSKYNKLSISFSGPGVTPLEIVYAQNNKNNYIKSYFVDILPDNDLIPRFEVTSGTIYRVICVKGILGVLRFECHSISRTICMMGMMCDEENYTGNLCAGIFDSKELEKMKNSLN